MLRPETQVTVPLSALSLSGSVSFSSKISTTTGTFLTIAWGTRGTYKIRKKQTNWARERGVKINQQAGLKKKTEDNS